MKLTTKEIAIISLNIVIIGIAAQITIPLGLVPFTLQVFSVYLVSFLYSSKISVLSLTMYAFFGFLGLPLFSAGQGGLSMFMSPTIGFILGFIPMAYINSKYKDHKNKYLTFFGASIVLYVFGLSFLNIYFRFILNIPITLSQSIVKYGLLFIPTDFIAFLVAFELHTKLVKQLNLELFKL